MYLLKHTHITQFQPGLHHLFKETNFADRYDSLQIFHVPFGAEQDGNPAVLNLLYYGWGLKQILARECRKSYAFHFPKISSWPISILSY